MGGTCPIFKGVHRRGEAFQATWGREEASSSVKDRRRVECWKELTGLVDVGGNWTEERDW